jgi:kynurenine formamidase
MYNGASASEVTSGGAGRSSIDVADSGIVGRGVLLDIPRLRGVDWLEPGDAITSDELDATGVTVEEGDIVLVHTGRDRRRDRRGAWNTYVDGLAGLDAECARWLHDKDPAVLGADGVSANPEGGRRIASKPAVASRHYEEHPAAPEITPGA